jgi:uncharacterized membrane protein YidH (DUF202 family)
MAWVRTALSIIGFGLERYKLSTVSTFVPLLPYQFAHMTGLRTEECNVHPPKVSPVTFDS